RGVPVRRHLVAIWEVNSNGKGPGLRWVAPHYRQAATLREPWRLGTPLERSRPGTVFGAASDVTRLANGVHVDRGVRMHDRCVLHGRTPDDGVSAGAGHFLIMPPIAPRN